VIIMCVIYLLVGGTLVFVNVARSAKVRIPKCCLCLSDKVVFPLLGVLDVLFVVVAGLTFAISIVLADLCYPNATSNLLDVIDYESEERNRIVKSTALFWTSCVCCPKQVEALLANDPLSNAKEGVRDALYTIGTLYAGLQKEAHEVSCSVTSSCDSAEDGCCLSDACSRSLLGANTDELSKVLVGANTSVDDLEGLVGCDFFPKMYEGILKTGMCDNIQPGLAEICIGCILGVGFLLVSLSLRSVFWQKYKRDQSTTEMKTLARA